MSSSLFESRKIKIRDPQGKEILMRREKVNAPELESYFQLVQIHLEGSDHRPKFHDKLTGEFKDLDSEVTYTIYGRPWKEELRFKPPPTKDELPLGLMIQVLKAKKFGEPEPEISRSPHGTLSLVPRTNDDPNKVKIKDKLGKQIFLLKEEVSDKLLEKEFGMAEIHLEGSDYCAKFADKKTGKYERLISHLTSRFDLQPGVTYTILGRPSSRERSNSNSIRSRSSSLDMRPRTDSLDEVEAQMRMMVLPNQIDESEQKPKKKGREIQLGMKEAWLKVAMKEKWSSSDALLQQTQPPTSPEPEPKRKLSSSWDFL